MSCQRIFIPIPNVCTVPCERTLTINGVSYDLSQDRSWTISTGSGTVTSITFVAGTGISLSGTNPITSSGTITIVNSAPDQVVSITPGTGISVTGTYPNFTISNTGTITTGNLIESTSSILTILGGTGAVVGSGTSIQVKQASGSQSGYLSSIDWTTFNNKQNAGNYITALTGDVTASGPGSVAATIANNAVTYAKMQAASTTSKLIGSSSSSTALREISIGSGLSLSGSTLSATTSAKSFGLFLSGSGGVISTGSKGYLRIPVSGTITSWTVVGDQASGSIVIDVKRSTYSGFPTTTSIAGTNLPTITSAQKATDSTLSGWGSTSLTQGDIIEFVVNSCTSFTLVTLSISYT